MGLKQKKTSNVEELGTLPPLKILMRHATSNIIGCLILSLYNIIDAIFVSNYLGESGLAA